MLALITRLLVVTAAFIAAQCGPLLAQPTVAAEDRLPRASIELKRNGQPATSTPWQLPKPGDPLYDAKKEEETKHPETHTVHVFERGVFKGYASLTSGLPRDSDAKKMDSQFMPNPKLPPDGVELSAREQPDKSDYFPTRPKLLPANVPDDYRISEPLPVVTNRFRVGDFSKSTSLRVLRALRGENVCL